jgi:hypothetical protein
MNDKKSPTHLIFTAVYFCLAVVTLIPLASASKTSLLGYKAPCSFFPHQHNWLDFAGWNAYSFAQEIFGESLKVLINWVLHF